MHHTWGAGADGCRRLLQLSSPGPGLETLLSLIWAGTRLTAHSAAAPCSCWACARICRRPSPDGALGPTTPVPAWPQPGLRVGTGCPGQTSGEDSRGCQGKPDPCHTPPHRSPPATAQLRGGQVLTELLAARARAAEAGQKQGLGAVGRISLTQESLEKIQSLFQDGNEYTSSHLTAWLLVPVGAEHGLWKQASQSNPRVACVGSEASLSLSFPTL